MVASQRSLRALCGLAFSLIGLHSLSPTADAKRLPAYIDEPATAVSLEKVQRDGWSLVVDTEDRVVFAARNPATVARERPAAGKSDETLAREALEDWGNRLGLEKTRTGLFLKYERHGLARDVFVFEQRVSGVPVLGGDVGVTLSGGEPIMMFSGSVASSAVSALGKAPGAVPAISDADATARVLAALTGSIGETSAAKPEGRSELVWWAEGPSPLRLAYVVRVPLAQPSGDWRGIVDATTGAVISLHDDARYADATGQVFSPNPVVTLEDLTIRDQNDEDQEALAGAYKSVTLQDVTLNGGVYRLDGPHVRIVDHPGETPAIDPPTSPTPEFIFTRDDDEFEAVMAYYHIDRAQRYLQQLGFADVARFPIEVDVHGLGGQDNSHYVPSSKRLAFGDGCVDDAEDADVIYHEYGHAIQDDQVPGWGVAGTGLFPTRSLGEGFGDYWASSLAAQEGGFDDAQVFDWDRGPADPCWQGRRVDGTLTLDDFDNNPNSLYTNGGIWAATLWEIRESTGGEIADQLVIESHFGLPTNATYEDNATSLALADATLFGGAHLPTILSVFESRGIAVDTTGLGPDEVAPELTLGVLQNPVFASHLDVVVVASEPLDPDDMAGTANGTDLDFTQVNSGSRLFRAEFSLTTPGELSIEVSARDFSGNEATVSRGVTTRTVVAGSPFSVSSPDRRLTARLETDALPAGTWVFVGAVEDPVAGYDVSIGGHSPAAPIELSLAPRTGESLARTALVLLGQGGRPDQPLDSWIDPETGVLTAWSSRGGTVVARASSGPTPPIDGGFLRLTAPWPNPTPGSSHIRFEAAAPRVVSLAVYSVDGRLIRSLFRGRVAPGPVELMWDGDDNRGRRAASGVYLFRLQSEGTGLSRKVILAR